jgi:hypothetical protein
MSAMRGFANDLVQRVHEYNTYMNVLETGGRSELRFMTNIAKSPLFATATPIDIRR